MADAMVTARMSAEKKEAGNRILEQMGTNASQIVNRVYDYIVENKELPVALKQEEHHATREEFQAALSWVKNLTSVLPAENPYATMTDNEIRREHLAARGLYDGWGE